MENIIHIGRTGEAADFLIRMTELMKMNDFLPDYSVSINNEVALCYFISKDTVSKDKGDMK